MSITPGWDTTVEWPVVGFKTLHNIYVAHNNTPPVRMSLLKARIQTEWYVLRSVCFMRSHCGGQNFHVQSFVAAAARNECNMCVRIIAIMFRNDTHVLELNEPCLMYCQTSCQVYVLKTFVCEWTQCRRAGSRCIQWCSMNSSWGILLVSNL